MSQKHQDGRRHRRCIGCHTCAKACKLENNIPATRPGGTTWTRWGRREWTRRRASTNLSQDVRHALLPALREPGLHACARSATYKDEETGVVRRITTSTRRRMCAWRPALHGVRSFNWEEPQHQNILPVVGQDVPRIRSIT